MFSGTVFRKIKENLKNIYEGRFSAVYEDPKRYENDSLYDEDTDYEDEYDTDSSDYIDEDEEDENALWSA